MRLDMLTGEQRENAAAGGAVSRLMLIAAVLAATGCSSAHSHVNRPLQEAHLAPDCRASLDIEEPRGEEDVLMILCLSGGGSRAAWFSADTMLRLENVVDQINLLHEVDVISSVSGGGLPAAYYCLTRDPGPYSVVRVDQLPDRLPARLAKTVRMDRRRGLLGVSGEMSPAQRDELLKLFSSSHDQARVKHLFWLSHHTHAPEVWRPDQVRALMTRNFIRSLYWASFSPLNLWDDWLYWTTAYDRSDQMAKIFTRSLYGAKFVELPAGAESIPDLEFLGHLDRPAPAAHSGSGSSEPGSDVLRWPQTSAAEGPVSLDWIPGYSPAQQAAQFIAGEVVMAGVRSVTKPFLPYVPYRFKDLNPERPYLIINATSATEDDPSGLRFGQVFTFTREDFKRYSNSSIDDYDVAHAVMASAAFPAVFSYVTLKDFRESTTNAGPRYLHLFDGGNADNLGLESAKRIILANRDRYRHFIVLVVDSHITEGGVSRAKPDVRTRIVDINFMQSFGTLLDQVRQLSLAEFKSGVLEGVDLRDRLTFWQLTFDDVRDPELRAKANQIPTDLKIQAENVDVVERCVADLIRPDAPKLQEILRVLRVSPSPAPPHQAATPEPAPDGDRQIPAPSKD